MAKKTKYTSKYKELIFYVDRERFQFKAGEFIAETDRQHEVLKDLRDVKEFDGKAVLTGEKKERDEIDVSGRKDFEQSSPPNDDKMNKDFVQSGAVTEDKKGKDFVQSGAVTSDKPKTPKKK